ncbi:MAG TPA: peptidoglycan-binding domain-containing protein, partial [Actinomycetes bacterium]
MSPASPALAPARMLGAGRGRRAAAVAMARSRPRAAAVAVARSPLRAAGARLAEDGHFGSAILAGARRFRRAHGLPAGGVAGQDTWPALVSHGRQRSRPRSGRARISHGRQRSRSRAR